MYDEIVKDLREKADFLAAAEPLHIKNAFAETMKQAADAIEELSKPRWIPVAERLPKEADGMVFVLMPDVFPYNSKQPFVNCNQDRRIDMAHYSEHSKTWYFGDCGAVGGQEPIAWIHRSVLPEPPKEGNDADN